MDIPRNLRYTNTHEWVQVTGKDLKVGITDFAQEQLGEITFVELPSVEDSFSAQDEVGIVESVKAASDFYAPVSGEIIAVNEALMDNPDAINTDPYGSGWLFKIRPEDPEEIDQLMDADQYEETLPSEE
ncbi:MAG TPA: glycine cleavage system protein GcvH [Kiritimatiellia bacterium]|nr:glycine cleavage system protein GcvH [Kiritimatiellia bacterium]